MSDSTLLKAGDYHPDEFDKFLAMREAVEEYEHQLENRLQEIHNLRCDVYWEHYAKMDRSWGYESCRNGGTFEKTSVEVKEVYEKDISLKGSQYMGGGSYEEFAGVTPILRSMLAMSDDELRAHFAEEAKKIKQAQDEKELAGKEKLLQAKLAEQAKLQREIAELQAKKS